MWCSKVLVAYDGSAKALHLARSIGAQDESVELVFAHVVKLYGLGTGAETVLLDEAKKVLVEMEQLADEVPNKAHAHLLKGSSPADLLLKCAQDEGCDLIVMGSRGLGALRGILPRPGRRQRLPWQRQLRRGAGIAYRRAHREGRSRRSDESRGDRLACLQLHEKSSGREISYSEPP